MSLANIKKSTAKSGFTIVELLIVVVVIAILAAITIVSYNGITTRANASASKSTAATWQKKLELYNAEVSGYPLNLAAINVAGKSYQIDGGSLSTATPTKDNGKSRVMVQACGTASPAAAADVTGMRITYFDYETPATPGVINIGTGSVCTSTGWAGTGTGA